MRVCAVNGTNVASSCVHVALADAVLLLGEHDDAAALRRLVGERASCAASASSCVAARRGAGRNAVAWRLPSVIVPVLSRSSTSTSPAASTARPRRRDDVRLDHAVHAGDADGREQPADGRRDEAHEQRHEHRDRDRRAPPWPPRRCRARYGSSVTVASRKMIVSAASRMSSAISFGVFWRLAPSTIAIIRSRKVSPGIRP